MSHEWARVRERHWTNAFKWRNILCLHSQTKSVSEIFTQKKSPVSEIFTKKNKIKKSVSENNINNNNILFK